MTVVILAVLVFLARSVFFVLMKYLSDCIYKHEKLRTVVVSIITAFLWVFIAYNVITSVVFIETDWPVLIGYFLGFVIGNLLAIKKLEIIADNRKKKLEHYKQHPLTPEEAFKPNVKKVSR